MKRTRSEAAKTDMSDVNPYLKMANQFRDFKNYSHSHILSVKRAIMPAKRHVFASDSPRRFGIVFRLKNQPKYVARAYSVVSRMKNVCIEEGHTYASEGDYFLVHFFFVEATDQNLEDLNDSLTKAVEREKEVQELLREQKFLNSLDKLADVHRVRFAKESHHTKVSEMIQLLRMKGADIETLQKMLQRWNEDDLQETFLKICTGGYDMGWNDLKKNLEETLRGAILTHLNKATKKDFRDVMVGLKEQRADLCALANVLKDKFEEGVGKLQKKRKVYAATAHHLTLITRYIKMGVCEVHVATTQKIKHKKRFISTAKKARLILVDANEV